MGGGGGVHAQVLRHLSAAEHRARHLGGRRGPRVQRGRPEGGGRGQQGRARAAAEAENLLQEEQQAFEAWKDSLETVPTINKLLHGPMQALRCDGSDPSEIEQTLDNMHAMERVFDLGEVTEGYEYQSQRGK